MILILSLTGTIMLKMFFRPCINSEFLFAGLLNTRGRQGKNCRHVRSNACFMVKTFDVIGPNTKHSFYFRHLIGRWVRVASELSAVLPDKGFWGVSYYEKLVRSQICSFE